MPYRWDLGWSSALLLVFFVFFPALALVVRRKWRQAEARRVEVMRLVRLAATEAQRAEREAMEAVFYVSEPTSSTVTGGGIGMSYCAVCHSPTTTRCSRCKVVKYCSGKCQIIHWRQGHKNECHPPPVDHSKGQLNVPAYNVLEIKGQKHAPNNPTFECAQAEDTACCQSMSESEGKLDEGDSEVSSKSEPPSEIHSENSDIGQKTSASTSGRTGLQDSITVQLSGDASSNENKTGHGQYTDANSYVSFGNLDKSLFGSFQQSSVSSTASERDKLSSSTKEPVNERPFDVTSSNDSKQFIPIVVELDCKFDTSLHTKSSSLDRLVDTAHHENASECSAVGLSSKRSDTCEISNISANCRKRREENLDSRVSGTASLDDCTASQTCSGYQPQMVAGFHSEVVVKISTLKSFSPSSSSDRVEPKDTKNPGVEKLRVKLGEKIDVQLKSPCPPPSNLPPVERESLKSCSSALNCKMPVDGIAKRITPQVRDNHSGGCSIGSGKYLHKMLFPYDVFIKLCNSEKVEMNPCGLVNLGNSCYANAALQCLSFTRPIAAYLLEGLHSKTCPREGWCFTCAFESLLVKAKQGRSTLSPFEIISHINDISYNFSQGREEDAHEFLRHAIDAMQSACLKEAGTSGCRDSSQETTLIQLIFGGYLNSKVKCMRCKGKSERHERMMDLSVEIHGDIVTLEEALSRFTATEILEGDNKYKCDRCNSYEQAKKQLTILEAPNVLVIALKRYQSGKFGKLNKVVRFPEYLNLAPYMRGSDDKSPVYRLYAVVVHNDVMNAAFSGHYVCYVKNMHGKWFKTDDSEVKEVNLQNVLSQGAYMLLYARCSPRAPSLLRKEIADQNKSKLNTQLYKSKTRPNSVFSHSSQPHFGLHDLFDKRRLHRDISSDSSSLFSCSDEGSSWSGESTKDSATTDDFTESSVNSPLRYSGEQTADMGAEGGLQSEEEGLQFLCRKLREECSSSSSSSRSESNNNLVKSSEMKTGVLFRRLGREKLAQTFY